MRTGSALVTGGIVGAAGGAIIGAGIGAIVRASRSSSHPIAPRDYPYRGLRLTWIAMPRHGGGVKPALTAVLHRTF